MALNLELGARQNLVMTQKMQLAVKILQMNSLDLEQHIKQAAVENPVLEIELPDLEDEARARQEKLEWLDRMDDSNSFRFMLRPDEEREFPLYEKTGGDTLNDTLLLQLAGACLSAEEERAARYLIGNLDENGYLLTGMEQLLLESGLHEELMASALRALQRMDPAGVGARDLRECLLLQTERLEEPHPVLTALIERHLDALAKNRLDRVAAELGVTLKEVKEAKALLLTLNPKPGNGFFERGTVPYIRPDLFVVHFEDGFQVIYNDYGQPGVFVNEYYKNLAKDSDPEAAAWLRERLNGAHALIAGVAQRRRTVLDCARVILARQAPFFERGPGYLTPMTLNDVAQELGLHLSTVSRAVNGKYLQSQWGVQRLGDFFSNRASKTSESASRDMAMREMRRILDGEDRDEPFSDQRIAELLALRGIKISRRTVAKYREGARIPPAAGRKTF
ncbi:MAG: RNA polymerase factor sigma-54 [Oscillospiraceae bacterium]|nr:RNA polymerase factor sigma-54 [Oscillospiraceae bacterium]